MTQHLFSAETLPNLPDLDANFSEIYGRSAYLATDSTRMTISTVAGAGNPFMATGQSGDNPYFEWQRWSGSASTFGGARISGVGNGAMAFLRAADAAVGSQTWLETARFDINGSFLIGLTASPGSNNPTNGVAVMGATAATVLTIGHASGSGAGSYYESFSYGGTIIGSITQNGTTGVAYNTSSDYRLKTNVLPISASGAFIDALNPCTWSWISDGTAGAGFIAHELQAVSPSSVTGAKDATQIVGTLRSADGDVIAAGVPQPGSLAAGQTWTQTGTAPVYQAVEYGSAEVIAMLVAEVKSLRARVHALDGH